MGEMNMGERVVAFGPKLRHPTQLGQKPHVHRPGVRRREQRRGARLVVEGEARAAPRASAAGFHALPLIRRRALTSISWP